MREDLGGKTRSADRLMSTSTDFLSQFFLFIFSQQQVKDKISVINNNDGSRLRGWAKRSEMTENDDLSAVSFGSWDATAPAPVVSHRQHGPAMHHAVLDVPP